MYLTLEVVSPQAASLGADRRRVVTERGLTVGRVVGNDWVIPDPYISKQHARISFADGTFFVEGLGRNAIAIGSASQVIPSNQPHPLRHGDRLFIDQYEMTVSLAQGSPKQVPPPSDDPFGVLPPAPGSAASVNSPTPGAIPDVWDHSAANIVSPSGPLDPMSVLGGPRAPEPRPPQGADWQRASALKDHFQAPGIRAPAEADPFDLVQPQAEPADPPRAPSSGIPDNWDRTNLNFKENHAPPPAVPRPMPSSPVARTPFREAPGARAGLGLKVPTPQSPDLPERRPPPPEPRPVSQQLPQQVPQDAFATAERPALPTERLRPAARPSPTALEGDLAELLRGAGLSGEELSPEVLHDLGKVLRVVVEGVMDVLRARAQIKSEFRLPMTRIQSAENNPLKHSPNVESALHTLLVQRNPGFLGTVQAFEDAFADIRNHQMAMLEGVRVAFESMLESFDPKELEKGFTRAAKRGFGSAKSKYWDLYGDRYTQLRGDADDTFRRLFGDVFAEAYEKQLERLKTLGRDGNGG